MRWLAFTLAGLVIMLSLRATETQAQAAVPTVEIAPATVDLPATGEARMLVVVHNTTSGPLHSLHLSSFPPGGLRVDFVTPDADLLPQGADWIVDSRLLRDDLNQAVPGTAYVRLDYSADSQKVDLSNSVVLGAFGVTRGPPPPADQVVDVQVQSAVKTLREDHPALAYLVLTNKADTPITISAVNTQVPPGTTLKPQETPPFRLEVRQTRLVAHELARVPAPSGTDVGQQLLVFKTTVEQAGVSRDVVTSFPLEVGAPEPVEQVVDVKVQATADSVQLARPARMLVVVTNKGDSQLDVLDIVPHGPSVTSSSNESPMLNFSPAHLAGTVRMAPQGSQVFPVEVTAAQSVQPGKHLVDFSVTIQHGGRTGQLVATQEVLVGVLGESELLTVLATPSLLLVPGFLIVAIIAWLGQAGWGKTPRAPNLIPYETLDPKNSIFWLAAITFSIVIGGAYVLVTRRPYLQTYGPQDVLVLWTGSLLIGVVAYRLMVLVQNYRWGLTAPTENDGPVALLDKIDRRKRTLLAMHATETSTASAASGLLVWLVDPPQLQDLGAEDPVWVAPTILYKNQAADLEKRFDTLINNPGAPGTPGKLARLLEEAKAAPHAEPDQGFKVDYAGAAGPRRVLAKYLTPDMDRPIAREAQDNEL